MWSSSRLPVCIGPIPGLILLSNPSDASRSYHQRSAQQQVPVNKQSQDLNTLLTRSVMQRALKETRLKIVMSNPANCHMVRHSFARHLHEDWHDIWTIQKLLWHKKSALQWPPSICSIDQPHPPRAGAWISGRPISGYTARLRHLSNEWSLDKG